MTATTPVPLALDRPPLAGRSALVTGTGAAGVAAARALASAGASVALAGSDDLALLRSARAIEANGGHAVPLPGDLRDPDVVRRVVDSAGESLGGVHLAVNTAGAVEGRRSSTDAACRGTYLAMRHELRQILAAGGGAIVNAAADPSGRHAAEAQCIIGLTRAAALDHMGRGVRVNAVITGAGSPSDFAAAVVWLCSDRAAGINGASVPAADRGVAA